MPGRADPRKAHNARLPPSIAKFAILQNCLRKLGGKGKTPKNSLNSSTSESPDTNPITSLSDIDIDTLDREAAQELLKTMRDRLKDKDFEIFRLKFRVENLTVQNQELINHVKNRRASTQAVLTQRRRSQQEGGQGSEAIYQSPLRVSNCNEESL